MRIEKPHLFSEQASSGNLICIIPLIPLQPFEWSHNPSGE